MTTLPIAFTAGKVVRDDRDAVDLIAEAHYEHQAEWVLLPVDLLPPDFFRLQTGVAGAIAQKFVNYRMKLAIVGDVSAHEDASQAFRDWVRETNESRDLWFVPDLAAFDERLDSRYGRAGDGPGA
jgi:hypothetical protein